MRKIFSFLMTMAALAAMVSCEKVQETEVKDASVSVEVKATTVSSVTFSLVPENAVSYAYACVKSEDLNFAVLTEVEGDEPAEITVSELEENTEYVIVATATNAAGKVSPKVTETFLTTSAAYVKIFVRRTMAKAIEVVFTPVNAASYEYAFAEAAAIDGAEFVQVEGGQTGEFLFEDLQPETEYAVSARAVNVSGEQGETATEKAATIALPTVEIKEVLPEAKSVAVKTVTSNADSVFYYVGAAEPAADAYTALKVYDNVADFSVFDLEPETEYKVYVYAKDRDGFDGAIVSQAFTTPSRGDIGLEVSNIGMKDMDLEIFFDKEKYAKVYFIAGDERTIGSIEDFPWDSYINSCKVFEEDIDGKFSSYTNSVKPETLYRIGIVPEDHEGNLCTDMQKWAEVRTLKVEFGYSEAKLPVDIVPSATEVKFKFSKEGGAESFWYQNVEKAKFTSAEELAKKGLNYTTYKDFEKEYAASDLKPETEYVLVAVAIDANGNCGELVSKEYSTTEIKLDGQGTAEMSLLTVGITTANLKCVFGEQAKQVRYLPVLKDGDPDYPTEESIVKELVAGKKKKILYSSGDNVKIGPLKEGTDYVIWYLVMDSENKYGGLASMELSTKTPVMDGNAEVSLVRCRDYWEKVGDFDYARLDYRIEPGANCKGYYRKWLRKSEYEGKSDEDILRAVVEAGNYFEGVYDKEKESIYSECYLVIVPVDNQDRLSPMLKKKLENTFNH